MLRQLTPSIADKGLGEIGESLRRGDGAATSSLQTTLNCTPETALVKRVEINESF